MKTIQKYIRIALYFVLLMISFAALLSITSCGASSDIPALSKQEAATYQNAKLNYLNNEYGKAEKGFLEITAQRSDFYQAQFMLGKTLFAQSKFVEAETIFSKLVKNYPQYHEAEIWLVRTEMMNDKLSSAETRIQKLLSFDSNDPRLLSQYAKLNRMKNEHTTSIQYLTLSTQFGANLALDHLELARYYFQFGLKEKALLSIDKCLLLLPTDNSLYESVKELKKLIQEMEEIK